MNVDLPVTSSRTRALEHVTSLSFGAPLDAGACVTLNFHPDRAVGDGRSSNGCARTVCTSPRS